MTKRWSILAATVLALAGCDGRDDMQQRTFQLERMDGETAIALLQPYVREGGTLSGRGGLITVRERPERLEQIAQVLARYDGAGESVRVNVYILEGGDFDGSSGLEGESTLRQLLPYRGYRLLDDASFTTVENHSFLREGGGPFAIMGRVSTVRENGDPVVDIGVNGASPDRRGQRVASVVRAPFGEMVVVASHRSSGEGTALIVALRTERVPGSSVPEGTP